MSPSGRPKGERGAQHDGTPVSPVRPIEGVDVDGRPGADSSLPLQAEGLRRPPGFTDQAALAQELAAGAHALGLALEPTQVQQMLAYLDLMRRWNAVYNITSVRDPADMLRQHLLDCLAVLPPLRAQVSSLATSANQPAVSPLRILDVGSGGGLPGVVLAIMQPDWQVTCIDTVAKKASFVQQVVGELGLKSLASVHGRVEKVSPGLPGRAPQGGQAVPGDQREPGFDVVASRAFASLANFVRLTHQHLAPGGVWMAMKGALAADEQAAVSLSAQVFHVEQLQVPGLQAQRCLVWMRPTPDSAVALG